MVNEKIEEKTKIIVSFLENTTSIDLKRLKLKFLEDTTSEVYLTGILSPLVYMPKSSIKQSIDDSVVFGGNRIYGTGRIGSDIKMVCYGDYCDYLFKDSHKFLSYRGKKKEFERNFALIPEKNKIFNDKFPFCVTALIIKKVQDNGDMVSQILQMHNIMPPDNNEKPVAKQEDKTMGEKGKVGDARVSE